MDDSLFSIVDLGHTTESPVKSRYGNTKSLLLSQRTRFAKEVLNYSVGTTVSSIDRLLSARATGRMITFGG
jgi:hypothetical protein